MNTSENSKWCFEEGNSKKRGKYKRKYCVKWAQMEELAWVEPFPLAEDKVKCPYCNVLVRAHRSDIDSHGRSRKHLINSGQIENNYKKKAKSRIIDIKTESTRKENPSEFEFVDCVPDDSPVDINLGNFDCVSVVNSSLSPAWVEPFSLAEDKVKCLYCNVLVRAHRSDIDNHGRSRTHLINSGQIENNFKKKTKDLLVDIKTESSSRDRPQNEFADCVQPDSPDIDFKFGDFECISVVNAPVAEEDAGSFHLAEQLGLMFISDMKKIMKCDQRIMKDLDSSQMVLNDYDKLKNAAKVMIGYLGQLYAVGPVQNGVCNGGQSFQSSSNISSGLEQIAQEMERSSINLRRLKLQLGTETSTTYASTIDISEFVTGPIGSELSDG